MPQSHIDAHIDLITKHEQEFLAKRTKGERLGDYIAMFIGSFGFVGAHLLLFVVWIGWNVLPGLSHFDPAPFSLLGTVVAMEAILLGSFILMRQARSGPRAEERDHLMLQILILAEKEITAVLKIDRQIAEQVRAKRAANSAEVRELSQQTSIEEVAHTIKENLDSLSETNGRITFRAGSMTANRD
jgi:uncharacterized membrane protein